MLYELVFIIEHYGVWQG